MAPALDPFYTSQAAQAAPRVTTRKVIRRTTRVPVWTRSDQGLPCEQDQVDGRVGHPVQRACKVMNAELARGDCDPAGVAVGKGRGRPRLPPAHGNGRRSANRRRRTTPGGARRGGSAVHPGPCQRHPGPLGHRGQLGATRGGGRVPGVPGPLHRQALWRSVRGAPRHQKRRGDARCRRRHQPTRHRARGLVSTAQPSRLWQAWEQHASGSSALDRTSNGHSRRAHRGWLQSRPITT